MRTAPIGRLARTHHFFHARDARLSLAVIRRRIKHWLRHASNRAIGAELSDLRFNPFVYLADSNP